MDLAGIKEATAAVIAALPALEAFVDKQRTELDHTLQALLSDASGTIQQTVGASLAAITAERTEGVNDVHSLLDRLNGAKAVFCDGGFRLEIPARIDAPGPATGLVLPGV